MMGKHILDNTVFESDGDIIDRIVTEQTATEVLSVESVIEYYHKTLHTSQDAHSFLQEHNIYQPEIIKNYTIGFCDGSINKLLGDKDIENLIKMRILKDGEEVLTNCLVIPIYRNLTPLCLIGIDITSKEILKPIRLKKSQPHYIFNDKAPSIYNEIIITDILSALILLSKGFKNVISVAGGSTNALVMYLQEHRVKTVINGQSVHGVSDSGCTIKTIESNTIPLYKHIISLDTVSITDLFQNTEVGTNEQLQSYSVEKIDNRLTFLFGDISYTLYGYNVTSINQMRVKVKAEYNGIKYPDVVDLFSSRSRQAYSQNLSRIFQVEQRQIENHLLEVLDYLETVDDDEPEEDTLSTADTKIGMKFLKSKNLFKEIVNDISTLGYVGDDYNKIILYLCASSRLLENPLNILLVSQSASGKSYLVDTIRRLIPEKDFIAITSLSDQALNYITDLTHKFLVFGESVHTPVIEHQIREMLSSQELTRLVAVRNKKSGELETKLVKKQVIVSSVMSSTNHNINPENSSRYFILHTDESQEQTERIHDKQREKYSIQRYEEKLSLIPSIIHKHHSAQQLLKKVCIVNPYAHHLSFPSSTMRSRRDNGRFIDLIASICFLRQYQKSVKKNNDLEYIECDEIDYSLAYDLMTNGVLASTLNDLSKGSHMLYESIRDMVHKMAEEKELNPDEISFIQREVRNHSKIGADSVRKYLKMLVDGEYLQVMGGKNKGTRYCYQLRLDEPIEVLDMSVIPHPDKIEQILKTAKS